MLLALFYLISTLLCLVHFRLENNIWPNTISESVMREDTLGNINEGGMTRYNFYITVQVVISIVIICNEIYLLRYYTRKLKTVFNNKIITVPYSIFIISVILGTIIGGQNYHSSINEFAETYNDVGIGKYHLSPYYAHLSDYSVVVIVCIVLVRTVLRTIIPIDKLRDSESLYLLPLTTILTLLSILLFMYTDVPRLYGLHISLTVIAAVSTIVFLDVRGIRYRYSAISLLFIYTCFIVQKKCSLYNYPRALIECAAFTGFFISYSLHNKYIRVA